METSQIVAAIQDSNRAFEQFIARTDARIDAMQSQFETLEAKQNRPHLGGWGASADLEEKAFEGFMRTGDRTELKAMATDTGPSGGFLVPANLDRQIQQVLLRYSPIRGIARVVATQTAEFQIPIMKTLPGASWAGERQARTETGAPELALVTPPGGDLYAAPALTQRLIDDAAFDVTAWIVDAIAQQFAITEGTAFVNGDGVEKPKGFLTYGTSTAGDATRTFGTLQYTATGQSGGFATTNPADKLIEALHTLAPQYRANAVWLMHSDTMQLVRQFKEATTNAYLWQPGVQAGAPPTLFGLPVVECVDMPTPAANSLSVAVGDFHRGYVVTDRWGTRLIRDELTSKPNVVFYAFRRTGGAVVDSNAIKLLKFAAS